MKFLHELPVRCVKYVGQVMEVKVFVDLGSSGTIASTVDSVQHLVLNNLQVVSDTLRGRSPCWGGVKELGQDDGLVNMEFSGEG